MTSAIVTGSTGFCGTRLVAFLIGQGVLVHRLSSGFHGGDVRQVDFEDVGALAGVLRETRPDYVFHLSGVASAADLATQVRVNCLHAAALLDAMAVAELHDTRVLMVGSAAEYGRLDTNSLPAREDGPTEPIAPYGITKLAQTRLALTRASRGLRITVARPSNIIGPGMPAAFALPGFARQLALIENGFGEAVLRVGNLDAVRDFIDVDDAVEIYWKLINAPEASGRVVNVASGEGVALHDALRQLQRAFGSNLDVRVGEKPGGTPDVPIFYASRERLDSIVGEHAYRPLSASVRAMVGHARREACENAGL